MPVCSLVKAKRGLRNCAQLCTLPLVYRAIIDSPFFLADYQVPTGKLIVEDVTASSILLLRAGRIEPYEGHPNPPLEFGMKVLLVRPGGFGDLVHLAPLVHALSLRGMEVSISSHTYFHPVMKGQPCTMLPYPMMEYQLNEFDAVCFLENAIEDSKDDTHIVDLFCRRVGIEIEDKAPRYALFPDELEWAQKVFPSNGKPRVALQVKASADARTYGRAAEVGTILIKEGCEVYLMGAPGTIRIDQQSPYRNVAAMGLDIRQSSAVLATCDGCVAPDSALCHIAAALNIPTVATYAAFPWQSRTLYSKSVHAFMGTLECTGCMYHSRSEPFPANMPCTGPKRCMSLDTIEPKRVVDKLMSMMSATR